MKKLQECRAVWTLNFDATCVEVVFENMTSVCDQVIQNWNLWNVQNERAAIIARWCSKGIGDVAPTSNFRKSIRRWFGENEWTCTGLHCLPICERAKYRSELFPCWECFHCATCGQFVHKLKSSFRYFELVPNLGTSDFEKSFDPTSSQFGNKWKFRYRTSRQIGEKLSRAIVALSQQRELLYLTSTQIEQKSFFIPDELSEISLPDNLSGSCSVTLDQIGPKWYEEI